ncbi:hypothetical protein HW555_011344 [Spodoptera exigua]|uniref:Uncharacterized protein n=1 Tax=Spodoptera exigua TaxID=7107 RepID=A0A835L024_SPOEX|nr:hypothetical protein HW555_011344 [Spodoptera exigua]
MEILLSFPKFLLKAVDVANVHVKRAMCGTDLRGCVAVFYAATLFFAVVYGVGLWAPFLIVWYSMAKKTL